MAQRTDLMSTTELKPRRTRVERGIYTRPDGSYEIGFRDTIGRQRWLAVDGGIRAARSALAQAHAQRARGERIAADPRLAFTDAASAWWEARVVRLRPATQSTYAGHLVRLSRPEHFGRARMADITPTDIARFVSKLQAEGLKGWTIRGHLTVISSVYRYAARHLGMVGANPVALLDRVERPDDDEKPKRVLNADELDALLGCVGDRYRLIFQLAAETGARLGEALGVIWDNIDLDGQTIEFTHQLDRETRTRQRLKTRRSRRCLEVTPSLIARLATWKAATDFRAGHDLVFVNRDGGGFDHRNIGGRVMRDAVSASGLGAVIDRRGNVLVEAPTFHSLRHSHASALIAAGFDIEEVSSRLGHASVVTTQKAYIHEFDRARRSPDRRARLATIYDRGAVPLRVVA